MRLTLLRAQRRAVIMLGVLGMTGISMASANNSGEALSLVGLPIGDTRDVVLPMAQNQWASQATCTTIRTGVGKNKRAYFLETCIVENSRGNTLFDETPATAHYVFLEDQLVQVAYHFAQVDNLKKLRRCADKAQQTLDKMQPTENTSAQLISVADDGLTLVSDANVVPKIHALQSTQ